MRLLVLLAVLLASVLPARAGASPFWERFVEPAPEAKQRDEQIRRGNVELSLARILTMSANMGLSPGLDVPDRAKAHAQRALDAYEKALAMGPPDADLHFRALTAAQMYLDDHRAVVRHADGLRKADPLDPRDPIVTLTLCHALSKIAGEGGPGAEALYRRAIAEYESWFARTDEADPRLARNLAVNHANAAELMMAVGDLSAAIRHYRRAAGLAGGEPLPYYGLAVALDRDGQPTSAREAMKAAMEWDPGVEQLQSADEAGSAIYFVPRGDKHYYMGLALEVKGMVQPAIASYRQFLQVAQSARPEYRALARRRITQLGGKVAPP